MTLFFGIIWTFYQTFLLVISTKSIVRARIEIIFKHCSLSLWRSIKWTGKFRGKNWSVFDSRLSVTAGATTNHSGESNSLELKGYHPQLVELILPLFFWPLARKTQPPYGKPIEVRSFRWKPQRGVKVENRFTLYYFPWNGRAQFIARASNLPSFDLIPISTKNLIYR